MLPINHVAIMLQCCYMSKWTATWVFTESKTSTAQVDSPLFPHIFLHQAVEQKHKEALMKKTKQKKNNSDVQLHLVWH